MNREKKFTPGPWFVAKNLDGVYAGKNNLVFAGTGFVAECSRQHRPFRSVDGGEANANLISAAPELLEALEAVCEGCTPVEDSVCVEICITGKAIKKAYGETE